MADPGRVIVITGSAQGIGRATAVAAGRRGMRVVGIDINTLGGEETATLVRETQSESWFFACDIADNEQIERTFATIEAEVGSVDVLVNSATLVIHEVPETITRDQWQRVMDVSLTGAVFVTQQVGRSMIQSGRGGSIVNLSSIAGVAALGRGNFAYSVAKTALLGATREFAVEWAGYGIRVNAIAPSQVDTEGFRLLVGNERVVDGNILAAALPGIPLGRLAQSADIVAAILFLASDDAAFITGVTLPVDGGSLALHAGGSLRKATSTDREAHNE
jgi:NAD(P)-dependent dehydrogenase (short-subunit alcohol dehydrogenase family)